MAEHFSPGVYVREVDLSFYASSISTCRVGMVGTARKGPVNVPTLVRSPEEFMRVFGEPDTSGYGSYAALQFLSKGNVLYYVRVGKSSAPNALALANITIQNGAAADVVKVSAITPGDWANTVLQVKITNSDAGAKTFDLEVIYNGARKEQFKSVSVVSGNAAYMETVLGTVSSGIVVVAGQSRYIVVEDLGDNTKVPANGTYTLVSGDSGWSAADADYVGTVSGGVKTGLHCFDNPDEVDINLVAVPGGSSSTITTALITLAGTTRKDCLAVLDPPIAQGVSDMVTWHTNMDSSYATVFWPWITYYDAYSNLTLTLPPSGFALSCFAQSDQAAAPWYAAAGTTRGKVPNALGVEYSADQTERDTLYGDNRINPVVNLRGTGVVIWGQKTLQKATTALDRINVRRLMLYLEKVVSQAAMRIVFEPNDSRTWQSFKSLVRPILEDCKSRSGIREYEILLDETTVTDEAMERNEMPGKIFIKPVKAGEFVSLDFILTPQGAVFSEIG